MTGSLGVLVNDRLSPRINWSTLGPPLTGAVAASPGAERLAVPPLDRTHAREWPGTVRAARAHDRLFWMQLSARPESAVALAAIGAGRARRSAYVIDAWPYSLSKIAAFARVARLRPCFVAMREAIPRLQMLAPDVPFVHLPFGADTTRFRPTNGERDIFAFSMGRMHGPLNIALRQYCDARGLRYLVSTGGAITDPNELGDMVGRSRYFVVTPPDLDHPERAGGFSPLVMRYLEGLAAGSRLLGTLPRSGEFEALLPVESILQVRADGSDLAERLDADVDNPAARAATDVATKIVRTEHSWTNRAAQIAEVLADGR